MPASTPPPRSRLSCRQGQCGRRRSPARACPSVPVSAGLTPPAGLLEPQYGFGKIWRESTGARTRDRLGWAVSPQAVEAGVWQAFQHGIMVWTPDPKHIYVLAESTPHGDLIETWRLYPDLFAG